MSNTCNDSEKTSGVSNVRKEHKVLDFFRCLRTLSPQASMFMSANCGLEGKAVLDRWMRKLNQRDRGVYAFHSNVKHMRGNIRTKCEQVS